MGLLLRCSLLLTVSVGATALAARQTAGLRHPGQSSYDDLLVAGAAWALVLCAAWAGLVCAAAVLEAVTAGRIAATRLVGCPGPARRALLAALGVAMAGGGALVAGPVSAAPAPREPGSSGQGDGLGLPVPARPTGAAHSLPRLRVEVRPGDSLWRLARQRAPTASTPETARLVARTYTANRRVIGPDPDLIRPGQRLLIPRQRHHAPDPETRRETP